MNDLEYILEVLRICAEHECCESVWWRTDEGYAPVTFIVNCNDFFSPSADAELITPENLPEFRKAFEDCAAVDAANPGKSEFCVTRAELLFVARVRKAFPWRRKYDKLPETMKPLFDAVVQP